VTPTVLYTCVNLTKIAASGRSGHMGKQTVDGQREKIAAERLELDARFREGDELARAYRREIGRMREEDEPAAAIIRQ
jgi:hypothetical protein